MVEVLGPRLDVIALRVRGFRGWQRAYLDRKDPAFARMMHLLPEIFPGERVAMTRSASCATIACEAAGALLSIC